MATSFPNGPQAAALAAADQTGSIVTPPTQDFNTPAMEGSMQQFLADNLGEYVVIEFLVGTQTTTTKAGILYAVGTSVVTLYQELSQTFVTCDMFSIKFVTFYLPGHRPWQVNNPLFGQTGTGMMAGQTAGMSSALMGSAAIAPGFAPGADMTSGAPTGLPTQDFGAQSGMGQMGTSGCGAPAWG